jgi:thymidylate synthase (FAD)
MQVKLLTGTENPLSIIAKAGRITRGLDEHYKSDEYYFRMLYHSGHHSTFEHVSFIFELNDISRSCSHQLVRFRIGVSFTQRSQRYSNESAFEYTTPPDIQKNPEALTAFEDYLHSSRNIYDYLLTLGIKKEDARFVLPNAVNTSLIMTMNYRELMHACSLRLCKKSQWEIRRMFWMIRREISLTSKILGDHLMPTCYHEGYCHEPHPCSLLHYFVEKRKQCYQDLL